MNWFEQAIAWISPRKAAERAYFRSVLELNRAYDAAKTGRRTEGWLTAGTSANAEIGAAASRIRARSRDLVRNNPWAASAVRKLAAKVIGTGIVPYPVARRDEVELRQAAMGIWDAFVENSDPERQLDFYGQTKLGARTMFESGEVLLRLVVRPSSWNLRVPLQVQVLEGDYIDASRTMGLPDGGADIMGVRYDAFGRRVGYWLFREHPGEAYASTLRPGNLESELVPASQVIHMFDPLRPGQARGVSMFTPVVLRMRDVDDYDDAEIARKKVAACLAAFVKAESGPTRAQVAGAGQVKTEEGTGGRRVETLSPGMIKYLKPGEEVSFNAVPGTDGYIEFMKLQLHAIAAGVGCTYEMLTGDLADVNYSSMRAGMIDFWDLVDGWQWHVAIPQACRPIWRMVGSLAVATGQWRDPNAWRARWAPPRRRWVDPVKEIEATRNAVRAGFMTLRGAIAEQGEDPDQVIDEIAQTNAQLDERDIVLDTDPRQVSRAGLTQARPPGSEIPDDDDGVKPNA